MSTDTNDQPAPAGVDGEGPAPNDDIDTEAFDRMEAPDEDEDDAADADDGEGDDEDSPDPDKADGDEDPDTEEVEYEGQKYRVPKALKDAVLRHADYTKKTQEVAEQRRTLEQERASFQAQREESLAALPEEHARLAVLKHSIERVNAELDKPLDSRGITLRTIDWPAYYRAAQGDEAMAAQYRAHREQYEALRLSLEQTERDLGQAKTDLQTKEAKRLEEAAKARQEAIAKQFEETARVLAAEVPGWNGEVAKQTAKYMVEQFGVTAEELTEATDPRIWKMAHGLMTAQARVAELEKALKQQQTAKHHEKAQGAKPAETGKGKGGAHVRDPATPRGDDLSTAEWMRRRNARLAKAG